MGVVLFYERKPQQSLVHRKAHQGLHWWHLLHRRRGVDSPPCAGAAIARAGDCGGISLRRRAGNACVQHQLRAATTADSVTRAQATAAIAPSPGAAVTLVSEFIAAFRRHSVATAPKPQAISGRIRSRTVQVFDAPRIHLSGTPEESISSPPVPRKQGLHHSVGWLLLTISKAALLSKETYTGSRRRRPWQQAVQFWGPLGSRHFPLETTKRHRRLCGPRGLPCVTSATLATREDIDVTLGPHFHHRVFTILARATPYLTESKTSSFCFRPAA